MNFKKENRKKKTTSEIICKCHEVERKTIEEAISSGAKTLNEVFDATTAGVGPCGGSCRGKIKFLLDEFQAKGRFPDQLKDAFKK